MRLAAAALALVACTPRPAWVPGERPYVAARAGFEASVPVDWMRRDVEGRELFLVTRDGSPLQHIEIGSTPFGKPLFAGNKRVVTEAMSPQELGELVVDGFVSSQALADARVLENAPETVSGKPGFRVLVAYRDSAGLPRRIAIRGVTGNGRLYWLLYQAPERHYFNLDLGTFEEVVRSFRLTTPTAPPVAPQPPPGPPVG